MGYEPGWNGITLLLPDLLLPFLLGQLWGSLENNYFHIVPASAQMWFST